MKVHIIYENYIAKDGKEMSVGGIQTYLTNLITVIKEIGLEVSLYQTANYDFKTEKNGVDVYAYKFDYKRQNKNRLPQFLYDKCKEYIKEDDILIFGTDTLIVKTNHKRTIGIQHGISWDRPKKKYNNSPLKYFLYYCLKAKMAWERVTLINKVKKIVCVDYNFVNWYRALIAAPKTSTQVIPNFSAIPENRRTENADEKVKIIFARRFFEFRGTRIFANAIERILNKHNNVTVTFAGEGPDEDWLKNKFKSEERVSFLKYDSDDSLQIHKEHDIAVVPTVGSEGTSLSLLEAMAAECAVVCSNVGGMTNIVLDEYNGLMFDPYEKDELFIAIDKLVSNKVLREKLADRAYDTVKGAFSLDLWKEKWRRVIIDSMGS